MATSTRSPSAHTSYDSPSQRPTKKSSFLSLKREKRLADAGSTSPQSESSHARVRAGATSPSSFHAFSLENPEPIVISGPYMLREATRSPSRSKSVGSPKEGSGSSKGKDRQRQERSPPPEDPGYSGDEFEESIPWPAMDADDFDLRRRTTSGPSPMSWDYHAPIPRPLKYPYRDSGSSTLSHFDPLPQTPVDDYSFRDRVFTAPHVVAAPVPGVAMMDALVDGMDASSDEDHYSPFSALSRRSKSKHTGHHPLYHPPLPKPPPGVTLGGGVPRTGRRHSGSDSEGDRSQPSSPRRRKAQEKQPKPRSPRASTSSNNVTRYPTFTMPKISMSSSTGSLSSSRAGSSTYISSSTEEVASINPPPSETPTKTVAPSISEIIRAHAPASQQVRSRPSTSDGASVSTAGKSSMLRRNAETSPTFVAIEEDADLVSRSSVDTIAEEVMQTLRVQTMSPVSKPRTPTRPPTAGSRPQSSGTDYCRSPLSEGHRTSTLFSEPSLPAPLDLSGLTKHPNNSTSQSIAQYLRSGRLTTVLKLTRGPHASRECPLNVSFSDLGSATGFPVVVFLGLGCVRHIMGLYDEMAELLGVRLITIDRWGLGRTDSPRSKLAKGIPEWASVVEEILDHLQIDQCSVMAHSAGAPYALAFANRFPERIRGDVCLLAPWVGGGEGAGYKWLKYVPNGILKTAQAAEWKVQAWMLGKPPSLAYEGIGFEVQTPTRSSRGSQHSSNPTSPRLRAMKSSSSQDTERRSMGSGGFSDYDDLRDFDGRFDSKSTLGRHSTSSNRSPKLGDGKGMRPLVKKTSRGFLGRFKSGGSTQPSSPIASGDRSQSAGPGKRLKALRSMGSLKGRSSTAPSSQAPKKSSSPSPSAWLPSTQAQEIGLGLDDVDWDATIKATSPVSKAKSVKSLGGQSLGGQSSIDFSFETGSRAGGRRSVSFGASMNKSPRSVPPVPPLPSVPPSPLSDTAETPGASYQVQLGNALIAASHAESSKGTHGDLLQILNHDRQPWGFSYSAYPHSVRIWYGDRDERIAENAVRWMENTMGRDKCQVQVVKGADHSLMFKSAVVIEVLEYFAECWGRD